MEPLRARLNAALGKSWKEWEIPHDLDADWPADAKASHSEWWQARIGRQKEIDASITRKPEFEYLYDKPYPDPSRIRVAGPLGHLTNEQAADLAAALEDTRVSRLVLAHLSRTNNSPERALGAVAKRLRRLPFEALHQSEPRKLEVEGIRRLAHAEQLRLGF